MKKFSVLLEIFSVSILLLPNVSFAANIKSINTVSATDLFFTTPTSTDTIHMNIVSVQPDTLRFHWDGTPWRVDQGGTGAVSFLNGSVLFYNNGLFAQNNANFFWDVSNAALSIGTSGVSSPLAKLTLKGSPGSSLFNILSTAEISQFFIDEGGRIGLGNTMPQHKLDVSGAIYSRIVNLSDRATIVIDWNNGNTQEVTLGGNRSVIFLNGQAGGHYSLILNQDGIGNRALTWPTGIKWAGGGNPPVLTSIPNATDVTNFIYNGTYYLGSSRLNYLSTVPPSLPSIFDNFESYNDGNVLNGQNGGSGWTSAWQGVGTTQFVVQSTVVKEGNKAVKLSQPASGDNLISEPYISRSFVATTTGTLHWTQRKDGVDHVQRMVLLSGSIPVTYVSIEHSGGLFGIAWTMVDGPNWVMIAPYTLGNFDTVDLQFDTITDKYRVSINSGPYTAWRNFINAVGTIDSLKISTTAAGLSTTDSYWDDIHF